MRRQHLASEQELFAKGLATYQKVVAGNYYGHREAYNVLHEVLLNQTKPGFVFADLACGSAPFSAAALAETGVGRYVGIDVSKPALDVAKEMLAFLSCPIELRCQDFTEAIDAWEGQLDVVWIGLSFHHLRTPEKATLMKKVESLLPRDGLFMIWEPTCLEGEAREAWVERLSQSLRSLPLTDEEFTAFDSHIRAADFRETAAIWKGMAREAGFEQSDQLFAPPDQLTGVYLFRH